jgi:hypothetical protein
MLGNSENHVSRSSNREKSKSIYPQLSPIIGQGIKSPSFLVCPASWPKESPYAEVSVWLSNAMTLLLEWWMPKEYEWDTNSICSISPREFVFIISHFCVDTLCVFHLRPAFLLFWNWYDSVRFFSSSNTTCISEEISNQWELTCWTHG